MKESLDAYREPFKAVVLQHLRESLPNGEWKRLRDYAEHTRQSRLVEFEFDPTATPETLLNEALSEGSISVNQTLIPNFRAQAVEIGSIAGQPVHYINRQGIYLWGLEPEKGFSLSVWVTHPAYPPGW